MKCCLSHLLPIEYLNRADEIKLDYSYRYKLPNLFQQFPTKDIVLKIGPHEEDFDWAEIYKYNSLSNGKLLLCLASATDCIIAQQSNLRFYYGLPITTYADFNAIVNYGTEYIILGAPLFFDFPYCQRYFKNYRAIPNVANMGQFFNKDNITGTWIRPENLDYYERFVKCIEFERVEPTEETALYRIYIEEHRFVGPLDLIIKDLEYEKNVDNNLIPDQLSIKRFACKQQCQAGAPCRFCYHMVDSANYQLVEDYLKTTNQMPEEKF